MLPSYPELVRRALDIFKRGFTPFVERQMVRLHGSWQPAERDTQALLRQILNNWDNVFGPILGRGKRQVVDRVRQARNMLAHENTFKLSNIHDLLNDIQDLLTCIYADQEVQDIKQLRQEIEGEQASQKPQRQVDVAIRKRASRLPAPSPQEAAEQLPASNEQPQEAESCPHCQNRLRVGARFCNVCGATIKPPVVRPLREVAKQSPAQPQEARICPHCQIRLRAGARFCNVCGRASQA